MNGDGRPDLVRALEHGLGGLPIWLRLRERAARLSRVDELIADSPQDGQNADEERQLIDVNNDGLVDWVRAVSTLDPRLERAHPADLFRRRAGGAADGTLSARRWPISVRRPADQEAALCTGANALRRASPSSARDGPAQYGLGFSEPIYTAAPFWDDADETRIDCAPRGRRRARARRAPIATSSTSTVMGASTGSASGYPWEGEDDWYVLFNLGDGRFGGGLEVLTPASPGLNGASSVAFDRRRSSRTSSLARPDVPARVAR